MRFRTRTLFALLASPLLIGGCNTQPAGKGARPLPAAGQPAAKSGESKPDVLADQTKRPGEATGEKSESKSPAAVERIANREPSPDNDSAPPKAKAGEAPPDAAPAAGPAPAAGSLAWLDGPPRMPAVLLSEGHAALCKVNVGDVLPNLMLPDREGGTQDLHSLLAKRWTVVCFWNGDFATAREALADLGPDVAVPYGPLGIGVVGVAVNQSPESAAKVLDDAKASFPNLIDADGAGFAQVGDEKLPRIFLVDSSGKILWFDLEYSRSTRRELRLAIAYLLNSRQAAR